MRIIYNPRVRLVQQPSIVMETINDFLKEHDAEMPTLAEGRLATEILTEFGGRMCYMSFKNPRPGGNQTYIDHIKEAGHGSVMEHSNYSFLVEDVSLNLTHELVRHRAGMAYSQLSGRYVDRGSSDTGFVMPDMLQHIQASDYGNKDKILIPFKVQCANQIAAYGEMRNGMMEFLDWAVDHYPKFAQYRDVPKTDRLKAVRGAARSVLGGALETKILVTANIRAIRHILEMRGAEAADAEICKMAVMMWHLVRHDHHFTDYEINFSPMAREYLTTKWKKV